MSESFLAEVPASYLPERAFWQKEFRKSSDIILKSNRAYFRMRLWWVNGLSAGLPPMKMVFDSHVKLIVDFFSGFLSKLGELGQQNLFG